MIRAAAAALAACLSPTAFAAGYAYDQPGDRRFVSNTAVLERAGPDNQSIKLAPPRAQVTATFTTLPVQVDGQREPAWDAAAVWPIANRFDVGMTAAAPAASANGTLRLLWDGPVLYGLVEVSGDATRSDSATPAWLRPSHAPDSDGLYVFMDVFNDQWGFETDTQGVFFLGANPGLAQAAAYVNAGIPSLGSFFHPRHQDHAPRLRAFASSGYRGGEGSDYIYEFALQIEGWGDAWDHRLANGTRIGLEIAIADQGNSFAFLSRTRVEAGREGGSNLPNGERARNRDWAQVTLEGWDGLAPFAFSSWPAEQAIRFWNSPANPGSGDGSRVWSAESATRMIEAKRSWLALPADASRASREEASRAVNQAFAALRWADSSFPDPHDLPVQHTLPDIWQFFDPSLGTDGRVTNAAQWQQRRQELLQLAQFYEYGYKPRLGADYRVELTGVDMDDQDSAVVRARVIPTNVRFRDGEAQEISVRLELPPATDGRRAPVAFGGRWRAYGLATAGFPGWAGDSRSDAGAWGNPNRSGLFYRLFPYERNSTAADSSILIANATGVSVALDILELAVAGDEALRARIDPSRAVTKGFSIGGKNAFVAALFDERVKATIVGGAGATGPANWRYNAQGQEYDFTGTPFEAPGAQAVVAHGTEGPGNSYRHNRVRETELFRHFMPYGHMYRHEPGSYAYGGYGRLPFDQALLVATLAPERAIMIDTNLNDFNDGAMTDNMSLQIARAVYRTLGADGSRYVRFNTGDYRPAGDPHGAAGADVEGRWLSDLFFGTSLVTPQEAERLDTDPFLLEVSDGRRQSPYDYYWGGFNTITGGSGGPGGTDGWYFHRFMR